MIISGKAFHVDRDNHCFVLLKETEYDPKTHEGTSRLAVRWTPATAFIRIDTQNDFTGVSGPVFAEIHAFQGADIRTLGADDPVVTLNVTILNQSDKKPGIAPDGTSVVGWLTPDPANPRLAAMACQNTTRLIKIRGPRAVVHIQTPISETDISEGFWDVTVDGTITDLACEAHALKFYPRVDPRTVDAPNLPRVLVIGDSISMNYHEAAKEALQGIANYHRIDGNGGDADRGVSCMDLWLGEYSEPGLHWDLIQFNHGLHDLKQLYDDATETYGDYQLDIESYKANLEKEIAIMKQTGATLMWCTTTPIPQSSVGKWNNTLMGRKNGADRIFNTAALDVISKHPDILINDLNSAVRDAEFFEEWNTGTDVHFWDGGQQTVVGQAVADSIKKALSQR